MAKPFTVDIVTPEGVIWQGEATFVLARTSDGEIGILADHEPTMGELVPGAAHIEGADGEMLDIALRGGFLQIHSNTVTLVTDHAAIVDEGLDAARAMAAKFAHEAEQHEEITALYNTAD
jgi:F-type H+-transporting ATPase subunit epsilon